MEAQLGSKYDDFEKTLGYWMGIGRDYTLFSATNLALTNEFINGGYKQFIYYPPVSINMLPPRRHAWSFLKPTRIFSTTADKGDYDLPATFGGLNGKLTFGPNSGNREIDIVPHSKIQTARAGATSSGRPKMAALVPVSGEGVIGQRWRLALWPTPDSEYSLSLPHIAVPVPLSRDAPYPLGGVAHSLTIEQSIIAFAEQRLRNIQGPEFDKFNQLLIASVSQDLDEMTPDTWGHMEDNSDCSPSPISQTVRFIRNGVEI